jgi:hypothetical protein
LSCTGSKCLDVAIVNGDKRLPVPAASRIPFILKRIPAIPKVL